MAEVRVSHEILPAIILSPANRTRDAARLMGESVATSMAETRRRIDAGEIKIHVVPAYEAVMASYRRPRDVKAMMDLATEYGSFTESLLIDQEGGILKGHRLREAAQSLLAADPEAYAHLADQVRGSCIVLPVNSIEDARTKIRAAHLASIGSLTEVDLNDVIADQFREYQRMLDEHLEELRAAIPGLPGRVRISSNFLARKLGSNNKHVDRVLANATRYPDLTELMYLPCIDARGVVQKGRNLPGESGGRGRRPRVEDEQPDASKTIEPTGQLEGPRNLGHSGSTPAASPIVRDPSDPSSDAGSNQEVTIKTGSASDTTGRHWAVEAVREAMLGARETPTWPIPAVPFVGALDELPPIEPSSSLADGGRGIAHLLHVARLLERKGQGCTPPGWTNTLDSYVAKVLESFEAWKSAWDKEGQWTAP